MDGLLQAGFLTSGYQEILRAFTYNTAIFWVKSDNRVCRSHIQVNSKLKEKTEKVYKKCCLDQCSTAIISQSC